ncbi:hypothetical protein HA402_006335 [Bradysia odoriphaga]|nr:hypothetical protein HA402_006335 [Bradysia odoriphaga]
MENKSDPTTEYNTQMFYSPVTYLNYPVRDSLCFVIPLTFIYSIIFISGILGNVITCVVITRNKNMHTATNYYLFSLAVSDLLLLVSGLPQEIYNMWYRYPYPFNEVICILQGFAAETSSNATVLTITAFTLERYIGICHPFLSHTMSKLSRAIKFILGIWMLSMILAVPQILDVGITQYKTCTVKSGLGNNLNKHVFTLSTISVFILPMTIISILYILIGLQLRRSQILNRNSVYVSSDRLKPLKYSHKSSSFQTNIAMDSMSPILIQYCPAKKSTDYCCAKKNTSNLNNNLVRPLRNDRIQYVSTVPFNAGARRVVKMLVVVVVTFFICWAPHHAQRLLAVYGNNDQRSSDGFNYVFDYLTYASGVLYFTSTCINPFLYSLMSYKFREAFKK